MARVGNGDHQFLAVELVDRLPGLPFRFLGTICDRDVQGRVRFGLIIDLDLALVLFPVDADLHGLSLESPLGIEAVVFRGHPGSLDCFDRW